jgi:hypothetical protein
MIEAINKAIDGSSSEVAENLFGPASFLWTISAPLASYITGLRNSRNILTNDLA